MRQPLFRIYSKTKAQISRALINAFAFAALKLVVQFLYFLIKYKSEILLSCENIQKKEGGPDCTFSNKKFSSVTLHELALAMKARKYTVILLSFNKEHPKLQVSSHLQWLYSPVCIGPGRKPRGSY